MLCLVSYNFQVNCIIMSLSILYLFIYSCLCFPMLYPFPLLLTLSSLSDANLGCNSQRSSKTLTLQEKMVLMEVI